MTARFTSPRLALTMLVLVYALNFVDRQILGILAGPIRVELGLSDTQLGALGGIAFALFYTALGIPAGRLADRKSRTAIITGALAIWSGFTALCGFAGSFWQLFACRLGVGIGEAGGVAPSYALIADMFPPERRARALSLYSLGIPIGSAAGILIGGWIAAAIGWRAAFIAAGIAGLIVVPLFWWLVPDVARGRHDPPAAAPDEAGLATAVVETLRIPAFRNLAAGAASASIIGYGLGFWLPSFLTRSHGLTLWHTSLFLGAVMLVGGIPGILAGGWLGDRLALTRAGHLARVPAIAFLITIPCYIGAMTTASLPLLFVLLTIAQGLALTWLGPANAAVQRLVPPSRRATASATMLFTNNLIGIGLGTVILGWLSDVLARGYGAESLRIAIIAGIGFYALASLFMLRAGRVLDTRLT